MLRIVLSETHFGDAIHVGGSVVTSLKSFDVDVPELERLLVEYQRSIETERARGSHPYWNRTVVGVEVVSK